MIPDRLDLELTVVADARRRGCTCDPAPETRLTTTRLGPCVDILHAPDCGLLDPFRSERRARALRALARLREVTDRGR